MENGRTENIMVLVLSFGRMEVSIKESGGTVKRTDGASLPVKTVQSTRENGLTAGITGEANCKRLTAKFSQGPLRMANFWDEQRL